MILTRVVRTLDASRFNEIANHESVRPWLGGAAGPLDLAPLVTNPANICFLGPHGGYICHALDLGLYEVHSLFLPEGRGKEAIAAMREAMRFMFCATDCMDLVTKCPDGNRAAHGIACLGGFEETFRRERAWQAGKELVGVSYRSLSFERWRARDPQIAKMGHWFHEKLEAAKAARSSPLPVHDDDEAHDRAVGASVLMAMAGNPRKAVRTYNRWAIFAGYAPISLLSEAPTVIDVVDAVVSPKGSDMEVLLCR